MKLSNVMLMPWRASPRSSNIFAMAIAALVVLSCVILACVVYMQALPHTLARSQAEWTVVVVILAFAEVFLWVTWCSGMLLLALHAARLRLPSVQRHVLAALVLYALLIVVLPAVVAGTLSYGTVATVCVLGLAAAAGLLVAIMPIYAYYVLFLGGMALQATPLAIALPGPGEPLFVPCALLALAGVLLAVIARWKQLLRNPNLQLSSWRKPIIMQLRSDTRCRVGLSLNAGQGNAAGADINTLVRRRPDWLQPRANLAHVDRQHPVTALRLGLGGMFMPVTRRAWLVRAAAWLLPLFVFLVVVALSDVQRTSLDTMWRSLFSHTALRALVPFATLMAIVVSLASAVYLQHYWRQRRDDLALLALLPGIGRNDCAKRNVLRASWSVPLCAQSVLLIVSLLVVLASGAGIAPYLLVLAPQIAGMAYVVAANAATMGGVPMAGSDTASFVRRACNVAAVTLTGLLFVATLILQMIGNSQATAMRLILLCACWAVVYAALIWIGRHGWRALQQRPHAFLPN